MDRFTDSRFRPLHRLRPMLRLPSIRPPPLHNHPGTDILHPKHVTRSNQANALRSMPLPDRKQMHSTPPPLRSLQNLRLQRKPRPPGPTKRTNNKKTKINLPKIQHRIQLHRPQNRPQQSPLNLFRTGENLLSITKLNHRNTLD